MSVFTEVLGRRLGPLRCSGGVDVIPLQLRMRFTRDKERGAKEHGTDKRADRDVRPRGKRDPDRQRRQQDRAFAMRSFASRARPTAC